MESAKYRNKEAVLAIQQLDFGKSTCSICRYIQKRMQNNDIFEIMNMKRPDISLTVCNLLQQSQPTTASVERRLLTLQKLSEKDRNFKIENVEQYLILHFNSCIC